MCQSVVVTMCVCHSFQILFNRYSFCKTQKNENHVIKFSKQWSFFVGLAFVFRRLFSHQHEWSISNSNRIIVKVFVYVLSIYQRGRTSWIRSSFVEPFRWQFQICMIIWCVQLRFKQYNSIFFSLMQIWCWRYWIHHRVLVVKHGPSCRFRFLLISFGY